MNELYDDLEFQIAVSSCLAEFNQKQFSLLDAVMSAAYYKFNDNTKSLIYLIYESVFDWNLFVLQRLRDQPLTGIEPDCIEAMIDELRGSLPKVVTRLRRRYRTSDAKAATLYLVMCHKYIECLEPSIRALFNAGKILAMQEVNNFLICVMEHVYRVMNELDYIVYGDKSSFKFDPFLSVDRLDLQVLACKGISLPSVRLSIYRESKLFQDNTISIKSYVDSVNLETNSHLNSTWESIISSIEDSGVKIICII